MRCRRSTTCEGHRRRSLRTMLFNLMLKRFSSTEVAERITNRIIEEAKHGEQHLRDYLRKNLEFTAPVIDLIADILLGSECALIAVGSCGPTQFPKVDTHPSGKCASRPLAVVKSTTYTKLKVTSITRSQDCCSALSAI